MGADRQGELSDVGFDDRLTGHQLLFDAGVDVARQLLGSDVTFHQKADVDV